MAYYISAGQMKREIQNLFCKMLFSKIRMKLSLKKNIITPGTKTVNKGLPQERK